jgi:hypothetical protein
MSRVTIVLSESGPRKLIVLMPVSRSVPVSPLGRCLTSVNVSLAAS